MADEPASTENRLDRLEHMMEQLLAARPDHDKAQARQEQHLDRPSTVEEQVRMELAKAKTAEQDAADKDSEKSERQTIKDTLAKLTEAKPEQPQPRRQRLMWGPR
jgi:hypothetical protein